MADHTLHRLAKTWAEARLKILRSEKISAEDFAALADAESALSAYILTGGAPAIDRRN